MLFRVLSAFSLLLGSTAALAAVDLQTTVSAPTGALVYDPATWTVTVANVGNQNSGSVSLSIQLPTTGTSPQNYVLGALSAVSSSCTQSGTTLSCNLGSIRKNRSTSVSFDLAMPWSSAAITVVATASTSGEPNTGNNTDSDVASLVYDDVPVTGPLDVLNTHCTGTGLTSFYACTKFPSSLSDHETTLEADGSITFYGVDPGYTGTWSQPSDDQLSFQYYYLGGLVADFDGNGVDGGCFEGLTTFPGSTYVSPYEVCPL